MRRNLLLAVGFASLGLGALPPPRALADDAALARVLAGSENESRARWEARLPELLDAFARDPDSPYAHSTLRAIGSLVDECRGRDAAERILEPFLTPGLRDGEIDEALRDVLVQRARMRGDFDKARSYEDARGYLRRFAAAGPFAWSDATLVHRRFGPEDGTLDPKATWEGSQRRVGWVELPTDPDGAWIDPWSRLRGAGAGVWYAVCRVKSSGTRAAALKVYCRDSFKVIVNGREAIVADRERDEVPETVWGDATLVDGWNRVLVKVTGRSTFALKVCDPETGRPLAGLEEGDPLVAGACPEPGAEPAARRYRTPVERVVSECLDASMTDPARISAAAGIAADDGRRWDAWKLHQKAAEAAGGADPVLAANIRARRGVFLSGFQPLPPVQRKLEAQRELKAAQALLPEHVGAAVRLAEYENEDDHPDRAVKALRASVAQGPSVNALMSLARIARQRGWEAESVEAASKALEVQPDATWVMEFLNDVDRRLADHEAVGRRLVSILAIDRNDAGAEQALAAAHRAQGRHAEALKIYQDLAARWPHAPGWRRQVAATLGAMGRDADALAAWKALEPELPNDEGIPRQIGELLELGGDPAGALDAYRRSLAVEPFQPNLWRVVARLEGRAEDFAAGWEPDVAQILADLPSTEELKKKHPKAVAVTVLDHMVTRVHPDGTARSYVHMIYKVLDEKGVEKYETLRGGGELSVVRAILPDGTVTTPSGLGGTSYNMEGLVPGTVLEIRYAMNENAGRRGWQGTGFWFQDTEIDQNPNPVTLSRLVLLTPDGMRLTPRKRNFAAAPRVEAKDGWTVTIWENHDAPVLESEDNRPSDDEIFPKVDYTPLPEFDDAAWELYRRRTDSRGSPMIDDAVRGCVTAGMGDSEKLRAIYDFVNREIQGNSASGQGATSVLLEKGGDRGLLFEAMIRTAGISYSMGRALPWNGEGRDLSDQQADAFSGPFLWIEPRDAAPFPFFMLGHHAPFGLVPEAYRGSAAFLLDETGGRITRLPDGGPGTDDGSTFAIRLTPDPESAEISGTIHYRSPNGYGFKRTLVDMAADDRRKFAEGQISRWFASPKLESYELPNLDARGEPLDVVVKGTMSTYVVPQGALHVVSLGLQPTGLTRRFVDKAVRQFDLVLRQRDDRVDEFTIDLGGAWEVASLPADCIAVHDVGVYSLTWRQSGDVIRVRRERHLHPARYRADAYPEFVAWCKSVDDAEERKLELRKVK